MAMACITWQAVFLEVKILNLTKNFIYKVPSWRRLRCCTRYKTALVKEIAALKSIEMKTGTKKAP